MMGRDNDFEKKETCREIAGGDEEYYVKLIEENVVENLDSLDISNGSKVDQCPDHIQDLLSAKIPKKKRSNPSKKPDHEQYTKTDVPPTSYPNVQPSQSDVENSRIEVFARRGGDEDGDYTPAECKSEGKKPMEYERARSCTRMRKVIRRNKKERRVKKERSIPKKVDLAKLGLEPPPGLSQQLQEFIQQIGGADVKLVVMKNLYKSDLEKHHDRLSIPVSQVRDPTFLNESDTETLIGKQQNIDVNVAISNGLEVVETTRMKLRYWHTNSQYALTSSWMGVVGRNRYMLTVNSIVQVWSFRVDGELWLILVKIRDAEVDDNDAMVESSEGKDDDDDVNGGKDANGGSSSTSFILFGVDLLAHN